MSCSTTIADPHTRATFQAFVDAIIPPTQACTGALTYQQVPGATNLCIHDYVIWELDHFQDIQQTGNPNVPPFSQSTAVLLDRGAIQLIQTSQAMHPQNYGSFPGGGPFSRLSRWDRLRAVTLLDQLAISLRILPPPYQNNPALIQVMMNSINQLTLFSYYSEWYGYGATRLYPPDFRRLTCIPPSWRQVGYPGPAFGYRDFRGFLLRYPHSKGADEW